MRKAFTILLALCVAAAPASAFGPTGLSGIKDQMRELAQAEKERVQLAQQSTQDHARILAQLRAILSRGGPIPEIDKPFLEQHLDQYIRLGMIGIEPPPAARRLAVREGLPRLATADWRITDPHLCANDGYNCIGWSVGENDFIWPGDTVRDFDQFYRARGLVPAASEAEADVALFALNGVAKHAARKLSSQWWESKLGSWCRAVHRLEDLNGPSYGQPIKFYRRARAGEIR